MNDLIGILIFGSLLVIAGLWYYWKKGREKKILEYEEIIRKGENDDR